MKILHGTWIYPVRSIRSRNYKLIWNLNCTEPFQNVLTANGQRNDYWSAWKRAARNGNATAKQLVDTYQQRPEFEFYDLQNDPYELHNRAEEPRFAPQIAALKKELDDWMKQQRDEGIVTEDAAKPHRTQRAPDGP